MSNKLLTFAVASLLTPVAVSTAQADAQWSRIIDAPTQDTAPVSGEPTRLRRTNEEQPGNEMPAVAFFADGKKGLYFSMNTELNGQRANHRMQLAVVGIKLEQDATTGFVKPAVDTTVPPRYVTNNIGNEYRNANHPEAFTINNGKTICAGYNYQANGDSDTKRYFQCFNETGATVMPQTLAIAKNNDDCSMREDGIGMTLAKTDTVNGKLVNRMVTWAGCNGNGRDDGWLYSINIECTPDGSSCELKKQFDVSLAEREERSHGRCTVSADDPNTAICSYTEGNNQPQRDGVWLAAVDITPGKYSGANQQESVYWKQQIRGRVEQDGIRTYAMRAMHSRVLVPGTGADAGKMVPSDMLIYRAGDLRGNNNTNGKGGTYFRSQVAVIKATKAGMSYVTPMTDVAPMMVGQDGTHLGMEFALLGSGTPDKLTPTVLFLSGSHTGGGNSAGVRSLTWDQAGNKFGTSTKFDIAPYDRHLYPNYLGNNPGNQGRNYANGIMLTNPYFGTAGNKDSHIMVYATTGKDPSQMSKPEIKLAAYLSVVPVAQGPASTGGTGTGTGSGTQGSGTGSGEGSGSGSGSSEQPQPEDPGTETGGAPAEMGGCSTTSSSTGLVSFLLIGLAAFIRRRRA